MDDLEEAVETCEMCGQENIRYVHYMNHPDYPDELKVGCVCAENMENDYVNPRKREQKLKNKASRKKRWPELKGWKHTSNDNYR